MNPAACSKHQPVPARPTSCLERLADGWNTPQDFCPECTRAFMEALDGAVGPLNWHPAFLDRATS